MRKTIHLPIVVFPFSFDVAVAVAVVFFRRAWESESMASASDLEQRAKEAFVDDNFDLAIDLYSQAIDLQPSDPALFADRAQANIKLSNFTGLLLPLRLLILSTVSLLLCMGLLCDCLCAPLIRCSSSCRVRICIVVVGFCSNLLLFFFY